jgi:hypothetical protein
MDINKIECIITIVRSLVSDPSYQREVKNLVSALSDIMDVCYLPEWLRKPNKSFEGKTPFQIIENGEIVRLWRMTHRINSGDLL